ncbi:HPr kinase/phosphorylase [Tropicimonas sp.]|uniref:HPr kinase/phosphorylase n=1 Tax=Tropicimonas sp. TaxID=2067044 RepID=UPI003A8C1805
MKRREPVDDAAGHVILHASAVEVGGTALLILGASGSGKSQLALDLIALGARLVADDRTIVRRSGDALIACAPGAIAGRIEARHVGLLALPFTPAARIGLAVDLDQTEPARLPPLRNIFILNQKVTLLFRPSAGHSASALLQCLTMRRVDP